MEEESKNLIIQYKYLEEQLKAIINEKEKYILLKNEIEETKKSLEEIKKSEIKLIGIGSNVFLEVQDVKKDYVLINVGSDVLKKASIDEAISFLSKEEKEIEEYLNLLENTRKKIEEEMRKILEKIQKTQKT